MKELDYIKNVKDPVSKQEKALRIQDTVQCKGRTNLTHNNSGIHLFLFIVPRADSSKHLNMCLT